MGLVAGILCLGKRSFAEVNVFIDVYSGRTYIFGIVAIVVTGLIDKVSAPKWSKYDPLLSDKVRNDRAHFTPRLFMAVIEDQYRSILDRLASDPLEVERPAQFHLVLGIARIGPAVERIGKKASRYRQVSDALRLDAGAWRVLRPY
jgi:hypothetical protein